MTIILNHEQQKILILNEHVIQTLNTCTNDKLKKFKNIKIEASFAYEQAVWKVSKISNPNHYFYIPANNFTFLIDYQEIIFFANMNLPNCPNEVLLKQYNTLKNKLLDYPEITVKISELLDLKKETNPPYQIFQLYFKNQKVSSQRVPFFGYEEQELISMLKELNRPYHLSNEVSDYIDTMSAILNEKEKLECGLEDKKINNKVKL
jgi:hypothetical protein